MTMTPADPHPLEMEQIVQTLVARTEELETLSIDAKNLERSAKLDLEKQAKKADHLMKLQKYREGLEQARRQAQVDDDKYYEELFKEADLKEGKRYAEALEVAKSEWETKIRAIGEEKRERHNLSDALLADTKKAIEQASRLKKIAEDALLAARQEHQTKGHQLEVESSTNSLDETTKAESQSDAQQRED